jgi:DNA-binding response OmpR family regulator
MTHREALPVGVRPLVCIVDDDRDVLEMLTTAAQLTGFDAVSLRSAEEFLASAWADDFDCLVLDIHLPGMTGLELLARLAHASRASRVLIVSGDADGGEREAARRLGAAAVLAKPFDLAGLIERIRAVVSGQMPATATQMSPTPSAGAPLSS